MSTAPIDLQAVLIEVLRRDTDSSAIVATGAEVFGDRPWPQAQRGVFAFRHDWDQPLVERLEWQTAVTRLASGNELRQMMRAVPRRTLSYSVGHARAFDALVADWLADHLGQVSSWPLPQYAVHLKQAAEPGDSELIVTAIQRHAFESQSARLRLSEDGLQGWGEGDRWVLIQDAEGWQQALVSTLSDQRIGLAEPLARAVPVGSTVMPLVTGVATEAASLTQWVPGRAEVSVSAQIEPCLIEDSPSSADDTLEQLPVWPDGNWRDDPEAEVSAVITREDLSPADPWVRRDDPWPTTTLKRRYLARNTDEIEVWRARLHRTQGRLEAFWLPDGLAPILWVTAPADPEAGFLRVAGEGISAWWHRPAACLIVHPDGSRQYALTATCHRDQGSVVVLRAGLSEIVPPGSRVIRLLRCRLDHDAIDLIWHTPSLLEIALTARQLPEPRGQQRPSYVEYGE